MRVPSWTEDEDYPDLWSVWLPGFIPEGTPETFAGFGRQAGRRRLRQFVGMLVRCLSQEANLPAVASAPLADQKMKTQTQPLGE